MLHLLVVVPTGAGTTYRICLSHHEFEIFYGGRVQRFSLQEQSYFAGLCAMWSGCGDYLACMCFKSVATSEVCGAPRLFNLRALQLGHFRQYGKWNPPAEGTMEINF
ncbi:hypothetical protein ACP275_06G128800 [Erythranthe tilingii]